MTIDERTRTALGRLTENEKACLRRRLLPQTAKEMAIDLLVSPHAIEKRLKMARTKLGVSSSLEAARLLAAHEAGYGQPVPEASDLAEGGETGHGTAQGAARRRLGSIVIPGAIAMTILLAAALAFGLPSPPQTAPETVLTPVNTKTTPELAAAFLKGSFTFFDRDRSGYLDPVEASRNEPRDSHRDRKLVPAPAADERDPEAEKKWMAKLDEDRDGRVSQAEYITYMLPWILLSGVPADWKPQS